MTNKVPTKKKFRSTDVVWKPMIFIDNRMRRLRVGKEILSRMFTQENPVGPFRASIWEELIIRSDPETAIWEELIIRSDTGT